MVKPANSPTASTALDPLHLADLERIDRRLHALARDLGNYLYGQKMAARDKGVLGSRGITQFIVESLRAASQRNVSGSTLTPGMTLRQLLEAAERAGYLVPTPGTLSQRLNQRSYRQGDIAWRRATVAKRGLDNGIWYWIGSKDGGEDE